LKHPNSSHAILGRVASRVSCRTTKPRFAGQVNRELTEELVDAGRRFSFDVKTEFPVRGRGSTLSGCGLLDVVWLWPPPSQVPGLEGLLPIVGFELESGWRTRKRVEGTSSTSRTSASGTDGLA
jgi:hypothetical protein